MGIADTMRADVTAILADTSACGSAEVIRIATPDHAALADGADVTGMISEIHEIVGEDGGAVSAGMSWVIVSEVALLAAFGELPVAVPDRSTRPWRVEVHGRAYMVAETRHDKTSGHVTCYLGEWSS